MDPNNPNNPNNPCSPHAISNEMNRHIQSFIHGHNIGTTADEKSEILNQKFDEYSDHYNCNLQPRSKKKEKD